MKRILKRTLLTVIPAFAIAASFAANSCGFPRYNVYLITDGGTVTDGSVNQVAYDGVASFSNSNKLKYGNLVPKSNSSDVLSLYKSALNAKPKAIVLSGAYHKDFLNTFYNTPGMSAAADKQKTNFYLVGSDLGSAGVNYRSFYSLEFNTEQAGFIAGFTGAGYLAQKYPSNPLLRKLGTYGGKPIQSVYNYMNGFAYGIAYFNTLNPTLTASLVDNNGSLTSWLVDATHTLGITSTGLASSVATLTNTSDYYTGGFAPNSPNSFKASQLTANYLDGNAQVIFPVAGLQTKLSILAITSSKQPTFLNAKVIGVDTPNEQEATYSGFKDYFIGSATLNVSQMVSNALKATVDKTYSNSWCSNGVPGSSDYINHICRGDYAGGMVGMSTNASQWNGLTNNSDYYIKEAVKWLTNVGAASKANLANGLFGTTI